MSKYGLPYLGSKATIAEDIINFLPKGKRLVDLFGGGGAISHCGTLSGKYEKVLYIEKNKLLCDLLKNAVSGKYNYENFKPEFVSREKFFELKEKDGYVKYIWSFGNTGKGYLFGKGKEQFKKHAHNFVIFNCKKGLKYLENHFKNSYFWHIKNIYNENPKISRGNYVNCILKIEAIRVTKLYSNKVFDEFKNLDFTNFRKLSQKAIVNLINKFIPDIPKKKYKSSQKNTKQFLLFGDNSENLLELKQLEQLERLQQLEQLQQLERLQRLQRLEQIKTFEIKNDTYLNYEFQQGDVVYCDPPYENTGGYDKEKFNHVEFYDWVYSRNFPVYFSSYEISDNRFKKVFEKTKRGLLSSVVKGKTNKQECIYWNKK